MTKCNGVYGGLGGSLRGESDVTETENVMRRVVMCNCTNSNRVTSCEMR
jgi:hypothetical protein